MRKVHKSSIWFQGRLTRFMDYGYIFLRFLSQVKFLLAFLCKINVISFHSWFSNHLAFWSIYVNLKSSIKRLLAPEPDWLTNAKFFGFIIEHFYVYFFCIYDNCVENYNVNFCRLQSNLPVSNMNRILFLVCIFSFFLSHSWVPPDMEFCTSVTHTRYVYYCGRICGIH